MIEGGTQWRTLSFLNFLPRGKRRPFGERQSVILQMSVRGGSALRCVNLVAEFITRRIPWPSTSLRGSWTRPGGPDDPGPHLPDDDDGQAAPYRRPYCGCPCPRGILAGFGDGPSHSGEWVGDPVQANLAGGLRGRGDCFQEDHGDTHHSIPGAERGRLMDRAFLHASISTSTQVADLSILGQLIFERMFPHADFQGRLTGHPRKIKAMVIPMVDASAEEVYEQLQKMHDVGLTIWYEAGGEKIVQLVSWWKFQDRRFAHPSKFPPPDGWKDRLRYNDPHNPKTLILENWEGTFGKPRTRKIRLDASNRSHDDAYIGNLHRPLTKEAQNDPSASASEKKDLSSESSDSDSPPSPTGAKEEPGNGKEPT